MQINTFWTGPSRWWDRPRHPVPRTANTSAGKDARKSRARKQPDCAIPI